MKRIVLLMLFASIITCVVTSYLCTSYNKHECKTVRITDTVFIETKIDKDKLCEAFIMIESNGNPNAVNKHTGATGILQLMPIMIAEANRLVGYDKYKLSDRTNKKKSVEVFHLIMANKNPNYDIHLACKIWNPRSKLKYHRDVENKYNELLNK